MIDNISKLLNDIEFGDVFDAFEAAKKIANNTLSKKDIDELARVAFNGNETYNKESAAYAISGIENRDSALSILINLLSTSDIHESVRGQAAEGIDIIKPCSRNKYWQLVETTLIKSLGDASPVVRFWSCYAVGQIKMKKSLPILHELKANDQEVCPGWWYVSEEAEDAIEWINGRDGKDRTGYP
jgi:HEAT repeat protein